MGKFKLITAFVMAVGLTFGYASVASAVAITCGDCHSVPPVNADNCANDARGLHGTHMNYSSASYPASGASCDYCHTAVAGTAPTATHNNSYVNVTSTVDAPGLSYDGVGATCANACHKNEGATAPWGNYSSASVKLSCNSCHDDSAASSMDLSGAHATHLGTAITVAGLGSGTDADCASCHPDNTGDGGNGQDGTVKAYSHASDGTNVVSDNATLIGGVSATRGAGATDTCAGACHTNSTSDQWGAGSLTCASCHYYEASPTSANNTAATVTLSDSHNAHFDQSIGCGSCHTVPGDTAHVSALPVAQDNATILGSLSFDDVANTCASTGSSCHGVGNTTPVWGNPTNIPACALCHNYPTVSGRDWAAGNGHASRYDGVTNRHLPATGYDAANDAYGTVTADASKCGLCHSGATHRSGAIDVTGNAHGNCGGNFTVNVNASGSDVTCGSVDCHSGKTTPNWW